MAMTSFVRLLLLIFLFSLASANASAEVEFRSDLDLNESDRVVLERFVEHASTWAKGVTPEKAAATLDEAGETFAWVDFRFLDALLTAYELTGDPAHLAQFHKAFGVYRGLMTEGDDGYLGWWGQAIPPARPEDNPDVKVDELQSNFRGLGIVARWAKLAQENEAFAAEHQSVIDDALTLCTEHLLPKWDDRGYYTDLGERGAVYHGLRYPLDERGNTLPHEKASIALEAIIRLHEATGDPAHLERAIKLGTFLKQALFLEGEHYEWYNWNPAGPWDVKPDGSDAWDVTWMAPDPRGPWYAAAADNMVRLYRLGLVFDDADLDRLIQTQRTQCWNGDLDNPQWRTVAGETSQWVKGKFLCYGLACYDDTLAELAFTGVNEQEAVAASEKAWQGTVGIEDYVRERYLHRPLIDGRGSHPDRGIGEAYLADPQRKHAYDRLAFEVGDDTGPPPAKPSEAEFPTASE